MKKIVLAMVALFVLGGGVVGISSASAQAVKGIRVGLSKPTVTESYGGELGKVMEVYGNGKDVKTDGNYGLEIGPVWYIPVGGNFFMSTGVNFSLKTIEQEEEYGKDEDREITTGRLVFVDVPVYVGYNFRIGSVSLYAQGGPFIGFKPLEIWTSKSTDYYKYYEDYDYEDYNKDQRFGYINAGVGLMAGININRFKFEFGTQQGLVNMLSENMKERINTKYKEKLLTNNASKDAKLRLNSFFVGISYIFN